jgi:hypothetical protein
MTGYICRANDVNKKYTILDEKSVENVLLGRWQENVPIESKGTIFLAGMNHNRFRLFAGEVRVQYQSDSCS